MPRQRRQGSRRLACAAGMLCAATHTVGQPADQSTDIDCRGFWTPCTGACEKSSQRTYEMTMLPEMNGVGCPTVAPDCQPGDGATTYLTGCLPSMVPELQYNRCIDNCEPTVASNVPPDADNCCRTDYSQCHEWQCVAHCSTLFLRHAGRKQTIQDQCALFSHSVLASGRTCGYSRSGAAVAIDCGGREYIAARMAMLATFENPLALECGRCLESRMAFCADAADGMAGTHGCVANVTQMAGTAGVNSGGCRQWVHGLTGRPRTSPNYVTCESLYNGAAPAKSHAGATAAIQTWAVVLLGGLGLVAGW